MIPSIPLRDVLPSSVLRVTLKPPFMVIPQSVTQGVQYLGLRRPRTHRGMYRSQFIGIIDRNDSVNKIIAFRIIDMRSVGVPTSSDIVFAILEVRYADLLRAQVFRPATRMAPEVVVTTVQQFARIGQAGKLPPTFVPSAPVLIT